MLRDRRWTNSTARSSRSWLDRERINRDKSSFSNASSNSCSKCSKSKIKSHTSCRSDNRGRCRNSRSRVTRRRNLRTTGLQAVKEESSARSNGAVRQAGRPVFLRHPGLLSPALSFLCAAQMSSVFFILLAGIRHDFGVLPRNGERDGPGFRVKLWIFESDSPFDVVAVDLLELFDEM